MSAALDLVREQGLGVVATTLSYQRVFDHLETTRGVRVTRASVHERIWDSQEHFQMDVLRSVLGDVGYRQATLTESATALMTDLHDRPTLTKMREITRQLAGVQLERAEEDPLYYSWVGVTMSLAKDAGVATQVRERLAQATHSAYQDIDVRITELLMTLGRRSGSARGRTSSPIPTMAGSSWSDSVPPCRRERPCAHGSTRPSFRGRHDDRPDGAEQTWSTFAAGYWALLQTFLEPIPEAGG
ncbi:MAG: hypothetical protein R2695_02375 [Acidimicrobiales bacterium]